jgi:hypothetical protein
MSCSRARSPARTRRYDCGPGPNSSNSPPRCSPRLIPRRRRAGLILFQLRDARAVSQHQTRNPRAVHAPAGRRAFSTADPFQSSQMEVNENEPHSIVFHPASLAESLNHSKEHFLASELRMCIAVSPQSAVGPQSAISPESAMSPSGQSVVGPHSAVSPQSAVQSRGLCLLAAPAPDFFRYPPDLIVRELRKHRQR